MVASLVVVNTPLELNLAASTPPSVNPIVSAAGKKMPVFVSPVVVIDGAAAEPAAKVAMLETVTEATETLVMLRLLIVRLVSARLVMLAEVADRWVRVAEPARSTVAEASDETRFVMDPEVAIRLVIVALEAVRFVTVKLLVAKSAM